MLKKIALAAVVLIGALLIFASTRPDTFRVERTATINAPAETVFPLINDFRNWEAWSPWEQLDPDMERTFGGSPTGEGAVYAWDGNSDVGSGRMEIVESVPPSKVTIQLDFTEPFESSNVTEFVLAPSGNATTVTWAMHGRNQFIGKLMGIFMNMDSMIGSDFEKGLSAMATAAENRTGGEAPAPSDSDMSEADSTAAGDL